MKINQTTTTSHVPAQPQPSKMGKVALFASAFFCTAQGADGDPCTEGQHGIFLKECPTPHWKKSSVDDGLYMKTSASDFGTVDGLDEPKLGLEHIPEHSHFIANNGQALYGPDYLSTSDHMLDGYSFVGSYESPQTYQTSKNGTAPDSLQAVPERKFIKINLCECVPSGEKVASSSSADKGIILGSIALASSILHIAYTIFMRKSGKEDQKEYGTFTVEE